MESMESSESGRTQPDECSRVVGAPFSASSVSLRTQRNPLPAVGLAPTPQLLEQSSVCDLDAAMQLLAERTQYLTRAAGVAIALADTADNGMVFRACAGCCASDLKRAVSAEDVLAKDCARTRELQNCPDAESDNRIASIESASRFRSIAVAPILNGGELAGIVKIVSGERKAFGESELASLSRMSSLAGSAIRIFTQPAAINREMHDIGPRKSPAGSQERNVPAHAPTIARPHGTNIDSQYSASPAKRPVFWSAAPTSDKGARSEPSATAAIPVPATLSTLRKCLACGFPVSRERKLCVECDEKQWRGHLPLPRKS